MTARMWTCQSLRDPEGQSWFQLWLLSPALAPGDPLSQQPWMSSCGLGLQGVYYCSPIQSRNLRRTTRLCMFPGVESHLGHTRASFPWETVEALAHPSGSSLQLIQLLGAGLLPPAARRWLLVQGVWLWALSAPDSDPDAHLVAGGRQPADKSTNTNWCLQKE